MTELVSPRMSKALAIALLAAAIWVTLNAGSTVLSERFRLQAETNDLQDRYEQLRQRRIEVAALKKQLASLVSSPSVRRSAIFAPTDRAAVARIQQRCRTSVERARGKLLSLNEIATSPSAPSLVAVQFRGRFSEPALRIWLNDLENGELDVTLVEFSLSSHKQSTTVREIEVVATLHARWIKSEDAKL